MDLQQASGIVSSFTIGKIHKPQLGEALLVLTDNLKENSVMGRFDLAISADVIGVLSSEEVDRIVRNLSSNDDFLSHERLLYLFQKGAAARISQDALEETAYELDAAGTFIADDVLEVLENMGELSRLSPDLAESVRRRIKAISGDPLGRELTHRPVLSNLGFLNGI